MARKVRCTERELGLAIRRSQEAREIRTRARRFPSAGNRPAAEHDRLTLTVTPTGVRLCWVPRDDRRRNPLRHKGFMDFDGFA
jgi:hypothetical protein